MATVPNTPGTPQPPPRYRRSRTFFGPVVLIIVGVLFMLGNAGIINKYDAVRWFALYWPAVIILWGILKLFEYTQARNAGEPYRGLGGGGIVLLIFVIIFGSIFSTGYRFSKDRDWSGFGESICDNDEDCRVFFSGQKYEFSGDQDHDFPAGSSLKVVLERGDIKIEPSTDSKLHLKMNQTIYANSQQEADKFRTNVQPVITVESGVVSVDASRHGDWNNGHVDLVIQVPRKAALDLMTLRGAVNVNGRDGDIKMNVPKGDVTLEDVNGAANVHMRSGDFTVHQVKGDVNVEGRANEIKVTDVTGQVTMTGEFFGDINVERATKGIRFKSSRTDLEFARLDGTFNMTSEDMRAEKIVGPVRVNTRSKDIHLDGVSGNVTIENSNGEVEVNPKAPYGTVDINNRNNGIIFDVPADAGFQMEVHANRGEIEDEFGLEKNESHLEKRASGKIRNGGPAVHLNAEHSTVTIRKH